MTMNNRFLIIFLFEQMQIWHSQHTQTFCFFAKLQYNTQILQEQNWTKLCLEMQQNENESVFLILNKIIVNNKCKNCPSMGDPRRTTQYVKLMTLQSMGVRAPEGRNVLLFFKTRDKKLFTRIGISFYGITVLLAYFFVK